MVVGGGPTGVEFAAEVRDFLREDVARMYPYILEDARVGNNMDRLYGYVV